MRTKVKTIPTHKYLNGVYLGLWGTFLVLLTPFIKRLIILLRYLVIMKLMEKVQRKRWLKFLFFMKEDTVIVIFCLENEQKRQSTFSDEQSG